MHDSGPSRRPSSTNLLHLILLGIWILLILLCGIRGVMAAPACAMDWGPEGPFTPTPTFVAEPLDPTADGIGLYVRAAGTSVWEHLVDVPCIDGDTDYDGIPDITICPLDDRSVAAQRFYDHPPHERLEWASDAWRHRDPTEDPTRIPAIVRSATLSDTVEVCWPTVCDPVTDPASCASQP